jgi:autotransporter-associated beta strand protein
MSVTPVMAETINLEGGTVDVNVQDNITNWNVTGNPIWNMPEFNVSEGSIYNIAGLGSGASLAVLVNGGAASNIFGGLNLSNLDFILQNIAGINIGASAMINLNNASLIASTLPLNLNATDFLAHNYQFSGKGGFLMNEGKIVGDNADLVALVANAIENRGVIEVPMGTVALAAGDTVTVGISPDGMVTIGVDAATANDLGLADQIKNTGTISANGGRVVLNAKAIDGLFDKAIHIDASENATAAVVSDDGVIEFIAEGDITNAGTLQAERGSIEIEAGEGEVVNEGSLKAARMEESGYTFRTTGSMEIADAYFDNIDGAADISGSIGAGTYNDVDFNVIGDITLTGNVIWNASGSFNMASDRTITGGARTLGITAANASTLGNISGVSTLTLNVGSTMSAAGIISGATNLVKSGTGILTLSGANTYTGTTVVGAAGGADAGTILLSGAGKISNAATTVYGGTLDLNGTTQTITTLALGAGASGTAATVAIGSGVLNLGGNVTYTATNNPNGAFITGEGGGILNLNATRTFTIGDSTAAADDLTITAIVQNGSAASGIIKRGTGTLTLTGANTYTGTTVVGNSGGTSGGTLSLSGAGKISNAATTVYGGTLDLNGTTQTITTLTLGGGAAGTTATMAIGSGVLNLGGNVTYTATNNPNGAFITGEGGGILNLNATRTFTINNSTAVADDLTITAIVQNGSATGGITKAGAGTLTLGGANTYTGATVIGASNGADAGTIRLSDSGKISNAATTIYAGTLDLNGTTQTITTLTLGGGASGSTANVNLGDGILNLGGNVTYTATNNPTGATISGGTLKLNGTRIFTIGDSTSPAANYDLTISSNVQDGGSASGLTKAGLGTLWLSGTNTYTGVTTINASAGILEFGKAVSLYNHNYASWTAANLIVNSGATLAFHVGGDGEFTSSDMDIIKTLGTGTSGLKAGARLGLDTTNAAGGNFTYGGVIANTNAGANAIGITKLGTGTLTLTGANTYTGTTIVGNGGGAEAGTLLLSGAGKINGAVSVYGGSLDLNGTTQTITTLFLGAGASGTTATVAIGSGVLNLGGNVTYASVNNPNGAFITGEGGGVLNLNVTRVFTINDSTAATDDLTISAIIQDGSGSRGFQKLGAGTLTLTGANTYTGMTEIGIYNGSNAGTLLLSGAGKISGAVVIYEGILDLNGTTQTVTYLSLGAGAAGSTATVAIGSGVLNLSGNVTFSPVNNSNGAFITGEGGGVLNLIGTRTFTINNSTATADDLTITAIIQDGSASGGITKAGNGTMTLTGAMNNTGAFTISAGTFNQNVEAAVASYTQSGGIFNQNAGLTVTGAFSLTSGTYNQNAALSAGSYAQSAGVFTASDPLNDSFSVGGSFSIPTTDNSFMRYTGDGLSVSTPYMIRDVYDLQAMQQDLDAFYKLNNNVAAASTSLWNAGAGFVPVGDSTTKFTGNFNGDSKTISGLTINRAATDYIGLFGYTSAATLSNVTLSGGSITGNQYVGALAGRTATGTITNATSSAAISGNQYVGGLVGQSGSVISASKATGLVTGPASGNYSGFGGLVGYNFGGTITTSYATGNVNGGTGGSVGGLVGTNGGNGVISYSYATGNVSGNYGCIGGLVGDMRAGSLTDSYATGNVSATVNHFIGGLLGRLIYIDGEGAVSVKNSYSTGTVSGSANAWYGSDTTGGLIGQQAGASTITNCYTTSTVTSLLGNPGGFIGNIAHTNISGLVNNWWFNNRANGMGTAGTYAVKNAPNITVGRYEKAGSVADFYSPAQAVYAIGTANQWDVFTPVWATYSNALPHLQWESFQPGAQNSIWTGNSSGAWETATNWSVGSVPGETSAVYIFDRANDPMLTAEASLANLTLASGAFTQNGSLSVSENLTVRGGTYAQNNVLNIEGDYIQSSGAFHQNNVAMNVSGNFSLAGGTFNQNETLGLTGNYGQTAGTFNQGADFSAANFSQTGGTFVDADPLSHSFSVAEAFTLGGSAAFNRFSVDGDDLLVRDIYDLQAMRSAMGTHYRLANDLDASSVATVTIESGVMFDPSTYLLSGSGANALSVAGTLKVNGASFAANYSDFSFSFESGSVVDYVGAGTQSVAALDYYDLQFTGGGHYDVEGPLGVSHDLTVTTGTLDVQGNAVTSGNNITNAGTVTASSGDLSLTATGGTFSNTGAISSPTGAITIEAMTQSITNEGTIQAAGGGVTLTAAMDATNSGAVSGAGDVNVTATAGDLSNSGTISTASGNMSLQAAQDLTTGTLTNTFAGGTIDLTGSTINLNGTVTSNNGNITFHSPVNVTENSSVNTGAGAGNIVFSDRVYSETAKNLVLAAGAGIVTFASDIGKRIVQSFSTYVIADDGGVYYYDGTSWTMVATIPWWEYGFELKGFAVDSNGMIYVAGLDYYNWSDHVYQYDGENWNEIGVWEGYSGLAINSNNVLYAWDGWMVQSYEGWWQGQTDTGSTYGNPFSFAMDANNAMYAGGYNYDYGSPDILKYTPETGWQSIGVPLGNVSRLAAGGDGKVLVHDWGNTYYYDGSSWTDTGAFMESLSMDANGAGYGSSGSTIYRYEGGSWSEFASGPFGGVYGLATSGGGAPELVSAALGQLTVTSASLVNINSEVDISGVTNLAGTVNLNAGTDWALQNSLTVNGVLNIQNGAVFNANSQTISATGDWTNLNSKIMNLGAVNLTGAGTISETSGAFSGLNITGAYALANPLAVTGEMSVSGSLDAAGRAITEGGHWSFANITNSSAVTLTGSGKTLTSGGNSFASNLTIAGSYTLADALTVLGELLVGGTLNAASKAITEGGNWSFTNITNSGDVTLTGAEKTITSGGSSFANDLNVNGSYTLADALTVMGDLSVGGTLNAASKAITEGGNWSFTNITNSGDVTLTGAGKTITSGGNSFASDLTVNGSYTLADALTVAGELTVGGALNAASKAITEGGNWSFTNIANSGDVTLTGAGKTITSGGSSFANDLTVNGSYTLADALTVVGDLSVGGTLNAASKAITEGGNWSFANLSNVGAVTLTGAGKTLTSAGNSFDDLTITGTYTFSDALTVADDLTITAGGLTQAADLTVSGDYTQTAGYFDGDVNYEFSLAGSFSVPLDDGSVNYFRHYEGSGINADPYIVRDIYDLQAMRSNLSSHFKLDMVGAVKKVFDATAAASWNGGLGFAPIGDALNPFTGSLHGNAHAIKNLFMNRTGQDYTGFFGKIGSGAEVHDLGLEDVSIYGRDFAGGMAGANAGSLWNVYTTGAHTVSGVDFVGGLVGGNTGSIENAYSSARVSSTGASVGGLVGNNSGTVDRTYAMGYVTGVSGTGGLVGAGDGTVTNSFWDKEMTGQATSAGGTAGKVTHMIVGESGDLVIDPEDAEDSSPDMMTSATYAGWDLEGTWVMDENGSYPHFQYRYENGVRGIWGKVMDETGTTALAPDKVIGLYVTEAEDIVPGDNDYLATTKTGANSMFYFVMGNDDERIQPTDYVIGGLRDPEYSGNTGMLAETGSITNLDIWGHLTRVIPHPHPLVPVNVPSNQILAEVDRSLQDAADSGGFLGSFSGISGLMRTQEVTVEEEGDLLSNMISPEEKEEDEMFEDAGIAVDATPQPGREPITTVSGVSLIG